MSLSHGGRIPVCMRCGSPRIHPQTRGEGLWPGGGEGVAWVCPVCHHIGAPFLMEPGAPAVAEGEDPLPWGAPGEAARWAEEVDAALAAETPGGDGTGDAGAARPGFVPLAFVVLGLGFLLPALFVIGRAFVIAGLPAVIGASVATGAFFAIGLVLIVVGLRRLFPARASRGDEATPPTVHR